MRGRSAGLECQKIFKISKMSEDLPVRLSEDMPDRMDILGAYLKSIGMPAEAHVKHKATNNILQ